MPLKEPFVIASQAIVNCEHVLCCVETDVGVNGIGSVATIPAFMGETGATIAAALDHLLPMVVGASPFEVDKLIQHLDKELPGNNSAKAAIDLACHDAMGKIAGLPLHRLLGGAYRTRVPVAWIIGLKGVSETVEEAVARYRMGFKVLKIKIGHDDADDREKIRLIRHELGDEVIIRADANCAYTFDRGLRVLGRMEQFGLELIEQPCRQTDIGGMAKLRQALRTPILADESVMSPEDAMRIVAERAADIINIKVGKVGGICKARRIAAIADAAGLPIVMSGNLELGPGIAASCHVAAVLQNATYATDIFVGGHKHSSDLIREDWDEDGMTIRVPDATGLGVTLRSEFAPESWQWKIGAFST
ncbi:MULTISPECIES: mandelate racemase/muconate lactonizing enzyme family protein [unclassified Bradyrhizobium]|nr:MULTISPECIES: enolase C-terminal domain-like protein [unclassified Bradyrhizobium]